jgi:hypothetical protein
MIALPELIEYSPVKLFRAAGTPIICSAPSKLCMISLRVQVLRVVPLRNLGQQYVQNVLIKILWLRGGFPIIQKKYVSIQ